MPGIATAIRTSTASRPGRIAAALILIGQSAIATAAGWQGDVTAFQSPNGVAENCIALAPVPGGAYSDGDRAEEARLCAIDLYAADVALCPKTFSTSPATLVYDLGGGRYEGRASAFESEQCAGRRIARAGVAGDPVFFKMTMNAPGTSATFAPASLLYYHFSRYFRTRVHVPVSVYRSMDREAHYDRVVRRGVEVSARPGGADMNRVAWQVLAAGAREPSNYRPADELYTPDRRQVYGILLREAGRRYGPEINGTRESGWGAGQNRDFQETAPYLALRQEAPLAKAIETGIVLARRDPALDSAMPVDPSPLQMTYWMTELTEIVLLDFLFSQQDRIGNIDYREYWYWTEAGEIRRMPATGAEPPARIAPLEPVRIRRTELSDNDAGGRIPYANFAKTTGMLEKLRHLAPDTYQRLQRLAADLGAGGEIYQWLTGSFALSERQYAQIVGNARLAATVLREACRAGRLRFDLDPEAMLLHGATRDQAVSCGSE